MTHIADFTYKRGCVAVNLGIVCIVGVAIVQYWIMVNRDCSDTPSYKSLLIIYQELQLDMSSKDIYPIIKQHDAQIRLIANGYLVPVPTNGLHELGFNYVEGFLELHTIPYDIFGRNRILGIQIENGKVAAVMIRTNDSRKHRPSNAPIDKIGSRGIANPYWKQAQ